MAESVCDYQSYIFYFRQFLQWNAFRGIFCIELNIQVSRITVIIDWFNCLVINENFSSSINLVMLHLCLIIHCVAEHGNHTNVKVDFGRKKNANLKIRLIREYFFFH